MFKTRFIWAVVLVCVFAMPLLAGAENYYLLTYGQKNAIGDRSIFLKTIYLDSARVSDSMLMANSGMIMGGHPIQLKVGGQLYLMAYIMDGFADRNATHGPSQEGYKIVKADSCLALAKADSFAYCSTGWPRQCIGDNYMEYEMNCLGKDSIKLEHGNYTIDKNCNFVKFYSPETQTNPCHISKINQFEYLDRLNTPNNHNLYYATGVGYWILRLNPDKNTILDSVFIKTPHRSLYLTAYHPITEKLYFFALNYEYHIPDPEFKKYYGDNWITPEVYIYDPESLELIEQDTIADFTQGNFPGLDGGLADVVRNYIVAYPFYCELREAFLPAMLFIFDTRTNTAKWLNVGWR